MQRGNEFYDLISVFFLALTVFVCLISLLIMGDVVSAGPFAPQTNTPSPTSLREALLNQPPTTPTQIPSSTATVATNTPLPSETWTPLPSRTASLTPTPLPSASSTISPTWTPSSTTAPSLTLQPTDTPEPTATATTIPTEGPTEGPSPTTAPTSAAFPLAPQSPFLRDAYLHPNCDWQGFGGNITLQGSVPGIGLQIQVTGDGITNPLTTFSGTNTNFGAAGWEIQTGGAPSGGRYVLQVFNADGTRALSPPVEMVFPGTCEENLAFINFTQVAPLE